MRNLFFLLIFSVRLFAEYDFTNLENEVNNARISVENFDKKNIKKVDLQKKELINLKEKLEQLKAKLEKQNTLDNLKLNNFEVKIKAAYDTKDKHKDIDSSFRQGDILEFTSIIQYPELEEETTTILQWQLFDEDGTPIKNYFKESKSQLINTSKIHKFKIRLGQNLKSGKYRVALTHFLRQNDKISQQSIKSFELNQEIEITNLKLFSSPKDTKGKKFFYHNQTPHLYAYFKLAPRIKKVNVFFNAVNQKGEVLYKYEGIRKRKSEVQRSGIKISDLKGGDTITFNALIIDDDGYEVRKSKSFKVRYYNLDIIANFNNLKYIDIRNFKLRVPKIFEKPFKIINLKNSNSYNIKINNSTLNGEITTTNYNETEKYDFIKIMVIDNKGREAVNVHGLNIKAKEKIVYDNTPTQVSSLKVKNKNIIVINDPYKLTIKVCCKGNSYKKIKHKEINNFLYTGYVDIDNKKILQAFKQYKIEKITVSNLGKYKNLNNRLKSIINFSNGKVSHITSYYKNKDISHLIKINSDGSSIKKNYAYTYKNTKHFMFEKSYYNKNGKNTKTIKYNENGTTR